MKTEPFFTICLACNILLLFERFSIAKFIYDVPTNIACDLLYPVRKTCFGFVSSKIYMYDLPT